MDGAQEATARALAVDVAGLRKAFGSRRVLWDLGLKVSWGECLVLFGANGSGKTTLIKVLASLLKPDAGTVRVAGLDRQRHGLALRAMVGVLGHSALLYDDLTPYENLRFYARLYGVGDVHNRVMEALRRVGMESYAQQRVRTLSHGMQKRVSIARAVLHRPRVLLLDEPESGLDQGAQEMLKGIVEEQVAHGASVVMTTHNLERGMALAHRIALLAEGRIVYQEAKSIVDAESFRGVYLRHTGVRL